MTDEFKKIVKGQQAEKEACQFLLNKGLELIETNYRSPRGEIDLVMQDKDTVVFIEVRLRHHTQFGSAVESVSRSKQQKLFKTALLYMQEKRWLYKINCRFDIIGFNADMKIEWVKDAIKADHY